MHQLRIVQLRNEIIKKRIAAIFISDVFNISYLTGFTGLSPHEREAYFLITEKSVHFITYSTYFGLFDTNKTYWQIHYATPFRNLTDILSEIIKKEKIKKMAVEKNGLNLSEYLSLKNKLGVKIIITESIIEKLRITKSDIEIKNIREAAHITDSTFSFILKQINKRVSERELALKIEFFIKKNAQNTAFSPIVAFNKNSAIPHYFPSNKVNLIPNSLILLDFGAKYNNYCADLSRVIFFGTPSNRLVKTYQIVLQAQNKALTSLAVGKTGKEIDLLARQYIEKNGFPAYLHGLGHGVGLNIHEYPKIGPQSSDRLSNNMVVTVEPGIYLPGEFGVRIEDLLLLKKTGVEILSKSTKEITII